MYILHTAIIYSLQKLRPPHIMRLVIYMTIEQIDKGKVLILLGKDDMRDFSLSYNTLGFSDPHSRKILSRLLTLACSKTGLSPENKRMTVEAIPHGSGCLLLLTMREKKRRRYRIKKTARACCCVFDNSEALIGAVSALCGFTLPESSIYCYEDCYYLFFDGALPAYIAALLEEYGVCVPCTATARARVAEYGREIGEVGEVGKYFIN